MFSLNPFNWFRKKPQRRRYSSARSYGGGIGNTISAIASDETIVEGIGSGIGSVAFGNKHTSSHGPVYSSPISDDHDEERKRPRRDHDHTPFIMPMPLEAPSQSHDHGHSHSHDCGSSSCDSGGGGGGDCGGGGGD